MNCTAGRSRKIVVMGYRGVGKTSIIARQVNDEFSDVYSPTIGNNYCTTIMADTAHVYRLQVSDTCGQDELSFLPDAYAINVDGYILVFSVSSEKSFRAVQVIYQRLLNTSGLQPGRFPVVLVANKSDLDAADAREVSAEAGKALAARWRVAYVETSAKKRVNVKRVFEAMASRLKDADDGQDLMSTTGFKKRRWQWWRKLSCTSKTER